MHSNPAIKRRIILHAVPTGRGGTVAIPVAQPLAVKPSTFVRVPR